MDFLIVYIMVYIIAFIYVLILKRRKSTYEDVMFLCFFCAFNFKVYVFVNPIVRQYFGKDSRDYLNPTFEYQLYAWIIFIVFLIIYILYIIILRRKNK